MGCLIRVRAEGRERRRDRGAGEGREIKSGERCGEGGMEESSTIVSAIVTHLETVKAGNKCAWSDFIIVCISS